MTLRTVGAVSLSAVALAAISGATPAFAAADCGVAPVGATLTVLSPTTCELDFSAAGVYDWTVPAEIYGLQALLVGAGSGSGSNETLGYAGYSGEVRYVDYSAAAAGGIVDVVVGAGGLSQFNGDGFDGEDSTTTVAAVTATADGGHIQTFGDATSSCAPEGDPDVLGANGNSATTTLTGNGATCETTYAPGLNPTTSATDSYGNARPAIFSTLNLTVAAGGRVLATANPLLADAALDGTGNGSDVHYTNTISEFDGFNTTGGSGRVILRYSIVPLAIAPAAGPALAATGVEAAPVLTIAALTAALGAMLLAASRRRRTQA